MSKAYNFTVKMENLIVDLQYTKNMIHCLKSNEDNTKLPFQQL